MENSTINSHTRCMQTLRAVHSSAMLESMERRLHVLAIAFPAQGHVGPLMKLSRQIPCHGIKVTFVSMEWVHARMLEASGDKDHHWDGIEIAAVPEGMEEVKDIGDKEEVAETRAKVMSRHFEELFRKMNSSQDRRVACVAAYATIGRAFEVAENLGIKRAMFWPTVVPGLILSLYIPSCRDWRNGRLRFYFEGHGHPALSGTSPHEIVDLLWCCPGDLRRQAVIFRYCMRVNKNVRILNWLLCNSFYELDHATCGLILELLPVGPLTSADRFGSFWAEDLA
ncbi:hypothetical protein NL676_029111 [Syzygium grande]|nr:hypothetical protein NL676_029111 [Syzygium grande]